jgi:ATP-dependent RNA helicase DDX41
MSYKCAVQAIEDPMEKLADVAQTSGNKGCAYCGGLGHRMQNCPKLRAESRTAEQRHTHRGPERAFGGEM